MKPLLSVVVFLIVFTAINSCSLKNQDSSYINLIKEMHKIECDALKKSGVTFQVNSSNIYGFRSVAFDKIMTKPDAKLIAHWEDLNHQLAVIEHYMDDGDKKDFQNNFEKVYLATCE
jgi:hypothetical protein